MLQLNTVNQILAKIYDGVPLAHALKDHGVPSQQFYYAIRAFSEKSAEYAQAKEAGAMMLAGKVLEVVQDPAIDAQRARNMMQAFQWYVSKMDPKTFGDKLDVNITERVDLKGALIDARRRVVRPISDQREAIEAQDAEYVLVPDTSRTGMETVPAAPDVDPFS